MKRLVFLSILTTSSLFAVEWDLKGYSGIGEGNLQWDIGTSDHSISTLSELKWKDLRYLNFGLQGEVHFFSGVLFSAQGEYGKIFEGINEDSDYSRSQRNGLYSFSRASANKGELLNGSLGIGYEACFKGIRLQAIAGVSTEEQHVRQMSPATFIYNAFNDPFDPGKYVITGSIQGLHSNYRARWNGPWVGGKLLYDWGRFHLIGGFEYHQLCYRGTGNWNLRKDLAKKFKHFGNGEGYKLNGEVAYDLTQTFRIGLLASFTDYRLKGGTDQVSYYDNQASSPQILTAEVPLNGVLWRNYSLSLTLSKQF